MPAPDPVPEDRLYSKDHHWVQVEADLLRIGLTDFAQDVLGEISFVQFVETGVRVEAGHEMGEVEALKAMSDLYMPVAATMVEVNAELLADPGSLNADPYGAGWLCRVQPESATAVEALLDAAAYRDLIGASSG